MASYNLIWEINMRTLSLSFLIVTNFVVKSYFRCLKSVHLFKFWTELLTYSCSIWVLNAIDRALLISCDMFFCRRLIELIVLIFEVRSMFVLMWFIWFSSVSTLRSAIKRSTSVWLIVCSSSFLLVHYSCKNCFILSLYLIGIWRFRCFSYKSCI